jgi:hypothetical protein
MYAMFGTLMHLIYWKSELNFWGEAIDFENTPIYPREIYVSLRAKDIDKPVLLPSRHLYLIPLLFRVNESGEIETRKDSIKMLKSIGLIAAMRFTHE